MQTGNRLSRRGFVVMASAAGAGAVLMNYPARNVRAEEESDIEEEYLVTPAEDLMFEHGVIERLLLIYQETARRLDAGSPVPSELIFDAANIIHNFVESYHEKLEEQYVFPSLEKTDEYSDLARTLRAQHKAGRAVTKALLEMTENGTLVQPERAAQYLRSFCRMYIPHIARENSVAFRAFHDMTPPREYAELGEQFEEKEHALFGVDGFHKTVQQVTAMERALNIHDLSQFTVQT